MILERKQNNHFQVVAEPSCMPWEMFLQKYASFGVWNRFSKTLQLVHFALRLQIRVTFLRYHTARVNMKDKRTRIFLRGGPKNCEWRRTSCYL